MKITKLILVGYIRLSLRQIGRIEYTPKEKTQIILGSNGSGKSSLLKELSPLPAVPAEYHKNGSKEIWIEHKGKEYYLLSSFTEDGNIFEFHCDGVNLNPGRTVTVFKELVKEHFSYTPELHALATGQTLFHELSVNERRKLFMDLSDDDFTYAFGYFNRLKERGREIQGTITQLQKRLSGELDGILTPEQESVVKRNAEDLRAILESLLMVKRPTTDDPIKLQRDRDTTLNQFVDLMGEIRTAVTVYENIGSRTPMNELVESIRVNRETLAGVRAELNVKYARHAEIDKEIKEIQATDHLDIKALEEDLAYLDSEKAKNLEVIGIDLPWTVGGTAENSLNALNQSYPLIQDCCDRLIGYKEYEYLFSNFREGRGKANSDLLHHNDLMLKEQGSVEYYQRIVTEYESHTHDNPFGQVDCPKCQHRFDPKHNPVEYNKAKALLENTKKSLEWRKGVMQQLKDKLKNYDDYEQLMSTIRHYVAMSPDATWFWEYMIREKIFTHYPDRFMNEVNRATSYLSAVLQIEKNDRVRAEKLKMKSFYEAAKGKDKKKLDEMNAEVETSLQALQTKARGLTETISRSEEELDILRTIQNLSVQFRTVEEELKYLSQETVETYYDAVLSELITSIKTEIVQKERMVAQVSIKKAVIADTEKAIESYKEELQLINFAIEALSPKTGLIAQGMTSSINVFINRVNRFISKVWAYPLSIDLIRPSDEDSLDLDYRFSVNVNNTGSSPDIAKTSSGMREIIHLACVITYMRMKGFDYHPVFLDEFAVKMDDAHRKAAYGIIEYLIDEEGVSQVFLISHYENGYSSLSASDITVLCDANIVLPSHLTYNQCAVIR